MDCKKCGQGMKCVESRGTGSTRYRRYKCLFCDSFIFTREQEMDSTVAKSIIWKLSGADKRIGKIRNSIDKMTWYC